MARRKDLLLKDRQRVVAFLAVAAVRFAFTPGNCSAFAGAAKSENYRGENRSRCSRIGAAVRGRPDYQPFLFYVRRPIVYVSRVVDLPGDASHYFLVQPDNESSAETARQWQPASPRRVLSIQDYRGRRVSVFAIDKRL